MSSLYLSCEAAMFGRLAWVNTAMTPSTESASAKSMRATRPLAMAEVMTNPCARPGTLYSAAYLAAPMTLARPSTREVAMPRIVTGLSPDAFVRLRLRRAGRGLRERAHDRAARQLDLEIVVAEAARLAQEDLRRARKTLARRRRAGEGLFRRAVAPRLVRHPAERKPRRFNSAAFDLQRGRDRYQREGVGQPVADFQVAVVLGEALRRQLDRRDDLIAAQGRVDLRPIARQAVEFGKGDAALAARPDRQHAGIERGERDAHVGRVYRNAVFARAEDRVHAVDAVDRGAPGAGRAFVARRRGVIEIETARPL